MTVMANNNSDNVLIHEENNSGDTGLIAPKVENSPEDHQDGDQVGFKPLLLQDSNALQFAF